MNSSEVTRYRKIKNSRRAPLQRKFLSHISIMFGTSQPCQITFNHVLSSFGANTWTDLINMGVDEVWCLICVMCHMRIRTQIWNS